MKQIIEQRKDNKDGNSSNTSAKSASRIDHKQVEGKRTRKKKLFFDEINN